MNSSETTESTEKPRSKKVLSEAQLEVLRVAREKALEKKSSWRN